MKSNGSNVGQQFVEIAVLVGEGRRQLELALLNSAEGSAAEQLDRHSDFYGQFLPFCLESTPESLLLYARSMDRQGFVPWSVLQSMIRLHDLESVMQKHLAVEVHHFTRAPRKPVTLEDAAGILRNAAEDYPDPASVASARLMVAQLSAAFDLLAKMPGSSLVVILNTVGPTLTD